MTNANTRFSVKTLQCWRLFLQHVFVALAVFAAASPYTSAGVLGGSQQIELDRDSNPPGLAEAFRFTASAAGTISTITVYVDAGSSATKLVVGVYADSAGKPGSLLTQGNLTSPVSSAWNTVNVPAANVSAGASYWIAVLGPVGSGTLGFRDRFSGTRAETSAQANLTTLPTTWTTGTVYSGSPISAYVSSAAATQPVLSVTPTTLSFAYTIGGALPIPTTLSVTNSGTGTLSFSASSSGAAWLSVAPTSGTAPSSEQVSVSVTGLAAGTYNGSVTITATGALGSPTVVPATLTVSPQSSASNSDWLMVGRDAARSGFAVGETTITKANVGQLALKWSTPVDGKIVAQPLFVSNIVVGGQARDVVIAATTANSIYALNAATGTLLWSRNFGANVGGCAVPGGNGLRGSPAIDKAAGRIYLMADDGTLRTLSLATGADAAPPLPIIDLPGTNKVRGGLNLVGSNLYIASGSGGCDTPPWRGRIYRVNVAGATPVLVNTFDTIPGIAGDSRGGGMWGYGGVSVDPNTGNVYAATGADANERYTPYGVRMLSLNLGLNLLGSFEPTHPATFPCNGAPCDVDFGATPSVFQPSGCPTLVAAGNKNGQLYLLRADDLASSALPLQSLTLNPANDWLGSGGVGGIPAYWPDGRMLFISDVGPGVTGIAAGVVGFSIAPAPACSLQVAWSVSIGGNTMANSSPTIANGIVFVGEGNGGRVHAYDASNGSELWNTGALIAGSTFAAPTVAAGKLFVGSWDGSSNAAGGTVRAFEPAASPPPPPDPCSGSAPAVLFGSQSIGNQLDLVPLGQAEAFQTTATACGKVGSVSVYLDATSTAAKVAIGVYSDANGHPGALLAQGSSTALVAGAWNTILLPQVNVTAGTRYWIAILGQQSGTPKFRDRVGGCFSETSAQTNLTALPASWSTGAVYADCPISAYGSSTP